MNKYTARRIRFQYIIIYIYAGYAELRHMELFKFNPLLNEIKYLNHLFLACQAADKFRKYLIAKQNTLLT